MPMTQQREYSAYVSLQCQEQQFITSRCEIH